LLARTMRAAQIGTDGHVTAGSMENGLVSPVEEGTPQGGPLSPLRSNIVPDEFDRELERRGLRLSGMSAMLISTFAARGPGNG
jgi:retron-type reverse transcriptase